MTILGRVLVPLVLAAATAACVGTAGRPLASPTPSTPTRTSDTTSDGVFEVRISTPKARVGPDESIEIQTSVTYVGPKEKVTAAGAAGGLVAFALEDVAGKRSIEPVMDAACAPRLMTRGVAQPVAFEKSGGWGEGDPGASFARWYLSDPVLRLPLGHWRITAELTAYVGTCTASGSHKLAAAVDIAVDR